MQYLESLFDDCLVTSISTSSTLEIFIVPPILSQSAFIVAGPFLNVSKEPQLECDTPILWYLVKVIMSLWEEYNVRRQEHAATSELCDANVSNTILLPFASSP